MKSVRIKNSAASSAPAAAKKPVVVYLGNHKGVSQPSDFTLCPLGAQFVAPRRIPDLTLLEFDLCAPASAGRRTAAQPCRCIGAVVRCDYQKSDRKYRVWVQFLDVPARVKSRIRCASLDGNHLCGFCSRF